MVTAFQKATATANGYHCIVIRRCNKAKLNAKSLEAHVSHDGVEVGPPEGQGGCGKGDEVFAAVLLKVIKDNEVTTFKGRAEAVSNTAVNAVAACLQVLGEVEPNLRAADAPFVRGGGGGGGGDDDARPPR